jgi:copper homeostasis protein
MILEICASSFQSALNAQQAETHRIELCSELAVGGITPSYGLIKQVVENLTIPVFVLIRPRSGNFNYSDVEYDIIKQDIQLCKELGCNGIVSGILNSDNSIDIKRTKQLIELSKPLHFTFHRAFDYVPNPFEALDQLIKLGAQRVLTSGQETSAEKGIDLLIELQVKANNKITIMPGGGINSENVLLFKKEGFKELHASATTINKTNNKLKVLMNSSKLFDETIEYCSDVAKIRSIINNLKND